MKIFSPSLHCGLPVTYTFLYASASRVDLPVRALIHWEPNDERFKEILQQNESDVSSPLYYRVIYGQLNEENMDRIDNVYGERSTCHLQPEGVVVCDVSLDARISQSVSLDWLKADC